MQNKLLGGFVVPQFEQRISSSTPHRAQNFARLIFSYWQLGHFMYLHVEYIDFSGRAHRYESKSTRAGRFNN
jgi:hypothetical protein